MLLCGALPLCLMVMAETTSDLMRWGSCEILSDFRDDLCVLLFLVKMALDGRRSDATGTDDTCGLLQFLLKRGYYND